MCRCADEYILQVPSGWLCDRSGMCMEANAAPPNIINRKMSAVLKSDLKDLPLAKRIKIRDLNTEGWQILCRPIG